MQRKILVPLCILCLHSLVSCSQSTPIEEGNSAVEPAEEVSNEPSEPHRYGGWYCPDNLNGFPAVDIADWKDVPVVNGRMATQEETQNGTSLIHVDLEKYPNAKPLDMELPKLARYYCESSGKAEIVIVIQALNISNDAIVGFRYLNGGNGSARLNEVKFLSNSEIDELSTARFVTLRLNIDAPQEDVFTVMTNAAYYKPLQAIYDPEHFDQNDEIGKSKVNFKYAKAGIITSAYAGDLWGSKYVQIDAESDDAQYVEKFLVLQNEETKRSDLIIVCGPYGDDYETQRDILTNWGEMVKGLSEDI